MQEARAKQWKHPSVSTFAGGKDPVLAMLQKASEVALSAFESGWAGPPFDPFTLAEFLRIPISPNSEILDARTVPVGSDRVRIEYNPNRPRARMRYSVAHEIAHTFFPDVAKQIRNRLAHGAMEKDEWELEMLCNLGAAELLMPVGSLSDMQNKDVSIRDVLELRKQFEVSTESVLLRLIRVTNQPYLLFAASKSDKGLNRYKVDYSISSRTGGKPLPENTLLPKESILAACIAIGYTAIADEVWPEIGHVHLECIGLSPYPDSIYPRVAGLLTFLDSKEQPPGGIQFVTGDATSPRGSGPKILAHVVNDATPNWGAGFGKAVQTKWPEIQQSFRDSWLKSQRIPLGGVVFSPAESDLVLCHMVSQRGYGPSDRPRIRYAILRDCLVQLRDKA